MGTDRERVITILFAARSQAVRNLCSAAPEPCQKGDLAKIQAAVLAYAGQDDDIPALMERVREIAAEAGTPPELLNEARVAVRYPHPSNPWADGEDGTLLGRAEDACSQAEQWLSDTALCPPVTVLAFYRFLIAAILDFRVLHVDYIPAIMRSVIRDRSIRLHAKIKVLPLSLAYGRQENSEGRLLILRRRTLALFEQFGGRADRVQFCATMARRWQPATAEKNGNNACEGLRDDAAPLREDTATAQPGAPQPDATQPDGPQPEERQESSQPEAADEGAAAPASSLPAAADLAAPEPAVSEAAPADPAPSDRATAEPARSNPLCPLERMRREVAAALSAGHQSADPSGVPALTKLLEHARLLARFHLPSVLVAHRSRQVVSHSLPPEVLGRIIGRDQPAFPHPGGPEEAEEPWPEPAAIKGDPSWLETLRLALGPTSIDMPLVNQLAASSDPATRRMGEFARCLRPSRSGRRLRKRSWDCSRRRSGVTAC